MLSDRQQTVGKYKIKSDLTEKRLEFYVAQGASQFKSLACPAFSTQSSIAHYAKKSTYIKM